MRCSPVFGRGLPGLEAWPAADFAPTSSTLPTGASGLRFILVARAPGCAGSRTSPRSRPPAAPPGSRSARHDGRADLGRLRRAVRRRGRPVPHRGLAPACARGREARPAARPEAHVVDRYCKVEGRTRWAIGDSAAVPIRPAGQPTHRRASTRCARAARLPATSPPRSRGRPRRSPTRPWRVRRHGPPEGGGGDPRHQVARVPACSWPANDLYMMPGIKRSYAWCRLDGGLRVRAGHVQPAARAPPVLETRPLGRGRASRRCAAEHRCRRARAGLGGPARFWNWLVADARDTRGTRRRDARGRRVRPGAALTGTSTARRGRSSGFGRARARLLRAARPPTSAPTSLRVSDAARRAGARARRLGVALAPPLRRRGSGVSLSPAACCSCAASGIGTAQPAPRSGSRRIANAGRRQGHPAAALGYFGVLRSPRRSTRRRAGAAERPLRCGHAASGGAGWRCSVRTHRARRAGDRRPRRSRPYARPAW